MRFRLTFLTIVLVAGRIVFDPNLGKGSAFAFPDRVPLDQAQFVAGQAIETKSLLKDWGDIKGYEYTYQKDNQPFKVKIHYLPESDGDIASYQAAYGLNSQKVIVKSQQQQGQTGFYDQFEHEQTAYLSSCINPRGASTVTHMQFFANRNTYDLKLDRAIPVILGTEDLRDSRCLWVTISTPIANQSVDVVHQQLVAVWQEIYAWWSPRFPKR
jgi:cyanosortase A-associated protein